MLTIGNIQIFSAFVFGTIFVVVLLFLAIRFPNPTSFQRTVFRIILSMSAAGVAAMIPGFINVQLSTSMGLALRAGGAIAVFTLVYFFNPADRAAESPPTPENSAPQPDWAFRRDARALKKSLLELPLSQRLILSAMAKAGRALRPIDFLENPDLSFTRREIIYMCRELEKLSFIEARDYTDKEFSISDEVLDTLGRTAKVFLSNLTGEEKLPASQA